MLLAITRPTWNPPLGRGEDTKEEAMRRFRHLLVGWKTCWEELDPECCRKSNSNIERWSRLPGSG